MDVFASWYQHVKTVYDVCITSKAKPDFDSVFGIDSFKEVNISPCQPVTRVFYQNPSYEHNLLYSGSALRETRCASCSTRNSTPTLQLLL